MRVYYTYEHGTVVCSGVVGEKERERGGGRDSCWGVVVCGPVIIHSSEEEEDEMG